MRIRWLARLCSTGLLCIMASACGKTSADDLDGRTFLLVSSDGFTPVPGSVVRLSFDGDEFGLHAGCNHIGGQFEIDGDELVIGSFGMTEIGCSAPLVDQDEFLLRFLMSKPKLQLEGDELTLLTQGVRLIFLDREVADPDRELVGTVWTVDTFINRDAASNLPLPAPPTIVFGEAGEVDVDTTCRAGAGRFEVMGATIVLSGMAYDEAPCPAGQTTADGFIRQLMSDGEVSFEIEAGRLTLERGTTGLGAFDASSGGPVER